jgi:hypothetical protein
MPAQRMKKRFYQIVAVNAYKNLAYSWLETTGCCCKQPLLKVTINFVRASGRTRIDDGSLDPLARDGRDN